MGLHRKMLIFIFFFQFNPSFKIFRWILQVNLDVYDKIDDPDFKRLIYVRINVHQSLYK